MSFYRARRVDKNQKDIVKALVAAGCSVHLLHQVGRGCPDLMVGLHGATWLMEVKTEKAQVVFKDGAVSTHAATAARQKKWREGWRGAPPIMVRSPEEALSALGLTKLPGQPTGVERFGPQRG